MRDIIKIFICLSIFVTIGLMIEYESRMSMQDKIQNEIKNLRYQIIPQEEKDRTEILINSVVMPSCLVGQSSNPHKY